MFYIDVIIISYNYYDYLDYGSVKSFNFKYDNKIMWFVVLGMKEWMINVGCKNVVELLWWEEVEFLGRFDFKFVSLLC